MGVTLYSRIPAIVATMPAKAGAVVQKTVMDIEAASKNSAAVDTGAMRASTQGRMTGPMAGEVTVGVEYGIYVEYGTHKMAAQPFLIPAAHQAEGPFRSAMAQAILS